MKRTLSLFLTFVLLFGLLPGTVVATEEPEFADDSDTSDTPALEQMYSGSSKDNILCKPANTRSSIQLYYDVGVDANVYERIPDSSEFILKGDLLGSVGIHNDDLTWDTRAAYPGMTGYLYTTVNDTTYAIPVQVGKAALGVYTVDTIVSGKLADNYVPQEGGAYKINYPKTGRSAYIIAGDGITITDAHSYNQDMDATVVGGKYVKVSVGPDFSDTTGGSVEVSYTEGNNTGSQSFDIQFKGDKPPQGDGDTSDAPELLEGSSQLYYMRGDVALTTLSVKALSEPFFRLYYANNDTLVPIPTEGVTFTLFNDLPGKITWLENENSWMWDATAAKPGSSAFLRAAFGGKNYDIFVQVQPAEFGVYTSETAEDDSYVPRVGGTHTINYEEATDRVAYIISDDSFAINSIEVSDSEDKVTAHIIENSVKLSLAENFEGTISVTANLTFQLSNGQERTRAFPITFTDGSNPDTDDGDDDDIGGNPGIVLGTLARDNNEVGDDDRHEGKLAPYYSISFDVEYGENDKKQTVYMGPSFYFGPIVASFGEFSGHSNGFENPDQYDQIGLRPVFFTKQENIYEKVTDEELLQAAQAAVSSYSIDLDVTPGEFGGVYYDEPIEYPTCYNCTFTVTGDVYPGYAYQMKQENLGVYIATLSVTLKDGRTLKSQSIFCWYPTLEDHRYITINNGEDPIDKVNTLLAGLKSVPGRSLMIHLPGGNFSGYLEVPYELRDEGVFFFGDKQTPTVITGGVKGSAVPRNIHFKGAGAGSEIIPTTWGDGQLPNQASLPDSAGGYGYVDFRECTLEGYYYALYSHGGPVKGATDCTFIKNHTAILIDCEAESAHFRYNYFRANDTAFEVKKIGRAVLHPNNFTGTIFIHNNADVVNHIEQNIFMPGVFFGYIVDDDVEPRECITNKPGTSNATKKRVFTYPQAANPNRTYSEADKTYKFSEFIYRTNFYESNNGKGPMISSNLSLFFPIPEDVLYNSPFRIMNEGNGKSISVRFQRSGN